MCQRMSLLASALNVIYFIVGESRKCDLIWLWCPMKVLLLSYCISQVVEEVELIVIKRDKCYWSVDDVNIKIAENKSVSCTLTWPLHIWNGSSWTFAKTAHFISVSTCSVPGCLYTVYSYVSHELRIKNEELFNTAEFFVKQRSTTGIDVMWQPGVQERPTVQVWR